ncbi:OLC1v1019295C1 [Oldenlandia corymbosa var. corymbosa]|uniref:OLC1v1019295C1 n=1 Tax=Oldenlandia corymbosa var. corymbosa TaxID=529605 RepID=A0AAV1EDL5_OLDCO|nr:OLC1v1019295C1 [Oldenlandia corymbosa var. corymbosa]
MGHQGQGHSGILKIHVVETSEMKLSSIKDGLKDVDTSSNDHGHIWHSNPSHQVLGSSPLDHEKQCCLNSAVVDFAAMSKMKLSSIEADIASDFSNLSYQEQDRLIMFDSNETRVTLTTADEMLKGLICNGRQHGAADVSAFVPSQFRQQDKSRLTTLDVNQAEISTTTSLVAVEVVGGNKSQVRHTDSRGDRVKQTVVSSQVKRSSNHAWIYYKRGLMRSNNKRRTGKSMQHSFYQADKAKSTNSLSGDDSLFVDVESDENQEEKYIAWLDYGAAVEWKFELTADRRILKSLVVQEKRRCTRAYAQLFGSTPKRIRAFYVEKIVAKKDDDMKPKVDKNSEGNEDNRFKNDEAEIKVVKPIEEQQIQLQLKDDNNQLVHAALSETNVESAINKEESRKHIDFDTV